MNTDQNGNTRQPEERYGEKRDEDMDDDGAQEGIIGGGQCA